MENKKKKSDITDYMKWRGDIPFSASPFNEIDALIFCQLSYADISRIAGSGFSGGKRLSEIAAAFETAPDADERRDLGVLLDPRTSDLLVDAGKSARFGGAVVRAFVDEYDEKRGEQFSAVTFSLDGEGTFVAFRGTDDTIVGWKEDFNLAFMESVPAQDSALRYLSRAMAETEGTVRVGGHSKGGNLAIYSAAHLPEMEKARIAEIFNFDGPGFRESDLASEEFASIKKKIRSFFPQFSIVGMLFHHFGGYSVVESDEKFIMQHNPFSWAAGPHSFVRKNSLDEGSEVFFRGFNRWFAALSENQRKQFVETLFGVIESSGAKTNTELSKDAIKNAATIVRSFSALEPEIRDESARLIRAFLKIISSEAGTSILQLLPPIRT